MRRYMNYMVIESQEDFDKQYDKNYKTIEHTNIFKVPNEFPICYRYREGWCPGMRGDWIECDIKEAIGVWNKRIQKDIEFVEEVEIIFSTKD